MNCLYVILQVQNAINMATKRVGKKSATGTKASKPSATSRSTAKKSGNPAASEKVTAKPVSARKRKPTQEEIALKAHEIYLERVAKGDPGDPDSDWHKARELL